MKRKEAGLAILICWGGIILGVVMVLAVLYPIVFGIVLAGLVGIVLFLTLFLTIIQGFVWLAGLKDGPYDWLFRSYLENEDDQS